MQPYKNILLATDLSEQSNIVAKKAAMLAKVMQAHLNIVHVMEYTSNLYGGGEITLALDGEVEENLTTLAREKLSKQAQTLNITPNQQWILKGRSKDEIIHLVRELKIDLLIVGSHHRHAISLLFNSTAEAILHAMPCDVVAVRVDE